MNPDFKGLAEQVFQTIEENNALHVLLGKKEVASKVKQILMYRDTISSLTDAEQDILAYVNSVLNENWASIVNRSQLKMSESKTTV